MRASAAALLAGLATLLSGAAPGAPSDPAWPQEWGAALVHLPAAWQVTTGDPSVTIAIVDTGLAPTRELRHVVPGASFVDGDPSTVDTWGHGSQVASVAAAQGDNAFGIAGTCWRCSIMPVRVAVQRGVTQANLASGIRYAVDHGARIVNVSFEIEGPPTQDLTNAVAYAEARDVLVVASAGNYGDETQVYPAALPGVLAVAATDQSDQLYPWSSRGSWVALTAPGCQIVYDPWTGPASICGTSFTPPVVAGIAGLLLSVDPGLHAADLARVLTSTAVPVAGVAYGRVDAAAALAAIGARPAPPPAPAPVGSHEVRLWTGRLAAAQSFSVSVARGNVEVQLSSDVVARCTMAVESRSFVALALPADGRLLSIGAFVARGRYRIGITCRQPRRAPYTLAIGATFAG